MTSLDEPMGKAIRMNMLPALERDCFVYHHHREITAQEQEKMPRPNSTRDGRIYTRKQATR